MAAASPITNNHSPRSSVGGGDVSSPQSRRARAVASPWNQIVRGESESVVATGAPSSPSSYGVGGQEQLAAATASSPPPDDSGAEAELESSDYSNAAKKPAWNKPSNGAVLEGSPVMGAVSWPALSESTKASPKSSSSDNLKAFSDGSLPAPQVTGSASSSSHKQATANNTNAISTPNHITTQRQKSFKRGGGSSGGVVSAHGGFPQPPPPLQLEIPPTISGKPSAASGESNSKDHSHKEGGQSGAGFGSPSHRTDHQPQRNNSFRRGNGGPHTRGDGSYHHNYGGKHQDRGNQDWNPHRNFGRDTHIQPHRVLSSPRGGYIRPSHSPTPFVPPPPVAVPMRPFGNPMVYPEVPSPLIYVQGPPPPDSIRGVPIVSPIPPHAMFFHVADPQLPTKIVNQIDYYFSNENLVKDTFLRHNMDDQGWVPISLIAGFKKVQYLTDNIQLILDSMRTSTVVEVQGDKVRKRNDWMRWIMPASAVSSPQPSLGRSSADMLAAHLQNVTFDQNTPTQHFAARAETTYLSSRSSSGDFSSHTQQQGTSHGLAGIQAGLEGSATLAGSSK